jgi:murein DD-endopeptidase MepM/ murein hydrolase activator NlpD
MGIFGDLSAFGAEQKRKRHQDLQKLIPIFSTWNTIEKNLSPEEKKTEKKFIFLSCFVGLGLFIVASITPHFQRQDVDFWPKGETDMFFSDDFVMAEEGFFGKSSIPSIGEVDRTELSEIITYEVQAGESLSVIASKFGIRVRTILDNNQVPNQNQLTTGMELKILPVDGVLYTVQSGDTLSGIAKKFKIDSEKIKKQNGLDEKGSVIAGKSIVIPGGKKLEPIIISKPIAVSPPKTSPPKYTKPAEIKTPPSKASPPPKKVDTATPKEYVTPPKISPPKVAKGKNVWPVRGRGQLTQGYHYGHYAIDIWGANKPDILAMKSGTVIKADGNCRSRQRGCNSGYGNVIVIDHGGGLQTLYAHNTSFYVKKGQEVVAGQAIAKMGNTGTVYGRTGIHLHFEVRKNGKRVNPLSYVR